MFFDLPLIFAAAAPEHASAKSHVQTPRDFCITTGAVIHARIVQYKEVSHDSENATASTPILGEN